MSGLSSRTLDKILFVFFYISNLSHPIKINDWECFMITPDLKGNLRQDKNYYSLLWIIIGDLFYNDFMFRLVGCAGREGVTLPVDGQGHTEC